MSERENEFLNVSFTDAFVFVHLIVASIGIIGGLVLMVFVPITQAHFITAVSIICTWLSMFGIVELMKYVMGSIHKKYNTGEMNRCRNQMIIGFAGITMCGIIPKIVFFYVDNPNILYYCFMTSVVTPAIFFNHFIYEFQEKWRVTYKKNNTLISILLAIQVVVLIVTMKIIKSYAFHKSYYQALVFVQFYTSVFFASSMIDMGVVLAGGIKKNQNVSALGKPIVKVNNPRHQQKDDLASLTEFIVNIHIAVGATGIIMGLLVMVFVPPIKQVQLIITVSTFGACLSIYGIVKLMKYVVVYVHKRYNTDEMKRCRNQMIIGFAGILLCGIIQRIVFFYVDNGLISYYSIITTFITSAIFYQHFIKYSQKKWIIDYKSGQTTIIQILWFYGVIVFCLTMMIASIYPDRSAELQASSLVRLSIRLFYTLMFFGPTMIDLVVLLGRGIIKKMEENVKLESVKTMEIQVKTMEIQEDGDSSVRIKSPKRPVNQLPKNLVINNMINEKM